MKITKRASIITGVLCLAGFCALVQPSFVNRIGHTQAKSIDAPPVVDPTPLPPLTDGEPWTGRYSFAHERY